MGDTSLVTRYTYNTLNQLETVTDPEGGVYRFAYDPNGNLERQEAPNGTVTTWSYDSQNRLEDLVTTNAAGETLQSYHYELKRTGHRESITEHDGTLRAYTYDDLWRLTEDEVTRPNGDLEYRFEVEYDPVGNRLLETTTDSRGFPRIYGFTYDSRDRIATRNGMPWEWGRGGRIVEEAASPRGGIAGRSYRWDNEDRLTSVEWVDTEGTQQWEGGRLENVYDVDGNRIESTETIEGESTTTRYLVDDSGWLSHVVAEIQDGELTTHYQRAGDRLLGLVRDGAADRVYHLDGLGSVRGLSDASGSLTDTYAYQAFGGRWTPAEMRDMPPPPPGDPQPYGFTGEPWSEAVELAYHRARWMNPTFGRFVSVDPFAGFPSEPMVLHKYIFALDSPTSLTDPSGLLADPSGLLGQLQVGRIRAVATSRAVNVAQPILTASRRLAVGITALALLTMATPAGLDTDGDQRRRSAGGRIQIQGGDLRKRFGTGTPKKLQWAWVAVPPTRFHGLAILLSFWNMLTADEQKRRMTAFSQATRYVSRGPHGPPGQSFFHRREATRKWRDTPRIDIEILAGKAFH